MDSWYITSCRRVAQGNACWDSIAWLLAVCSLHYLQAHHWPTHRRICRESSQHLTAAWLRIRNLPRDGISMRNRRCTTCGWVTGNLYADVELCYECHEPAICNDCTYDVPHFGRRCYECEPLPLHMDLRFLPLLALTDHAGEVHDYTFGFGAYHPSSFGGYQLRVKRLAFIAWKQSELLSQSRVIFCVQEAA